jgi:membrane-associated phospholipid phosphatase
MGGVSSLLADRRSRGLRIGLFFSVYLPLLIFISIAISLRFNDRIFPWDAAILLALHRTHTVGLDRFAEVFTQLGMVWGVFPVAVAIALFLLIQRQWRVLLFWLLTFIGTSLTGVVLKLLWHRARPHLWDSLYPYPKDFSFPSGHAMASMTLIAALLALFWGTRWVWTILVLGGLFVLGIGWTRLYLGVHYPSDIMAGWMMAIAWVTGLRYFFSHGLEKETLTQACAKSNTE